MCRCASAVSCRPRRVAALAQRAICLGAMVGGALPQPGPPWRDFIETSPASTRRSPTELRTPHKGARTATVPTQQPGAATAVLTHATQKILPTDPAPATGRGSLRLTAARNEYEPLLVVLSGAQTVSAVTATVLVGDKPLPTAVYRVAYISVVNSTGDVFLPRCHLANSKHHYRRSTLPTASPLVLASCRMR